MSGKGPGPGDAPTAGEASPPAPAPDALAKIEALTSRVDFLGSHVATLQSILNITRSDFQRLEHELDAARSMHDVPDSLFRDLEAHRASAAYRRVYETEHPRVSVCVATYNRAELLVRRCLPSVLSQNYPNLEIVVVGDGCTDDTEAAVRSLNDPRIVFENLSQRQSLPEDPAARWMVAGTDASNRGFALATGDITTYLDDDDEYLPDRIPKLVSFLREHRLELVWHPFLWEVEKGTWDTCPGAEFRLAQVTSGSLMAISWFNRLPWNPKSHLYREPGDWNRFRKLKHLGARMRRFPEPLLRHYVERNQKF